MCSSLTAYGVISPYAVCINTKLSQIAFVKTEHQRKVASGRVTADIHHARVTSILPNMLHYPCNGFCSILCILRVPGPWIEPVVRSDNSNTLIPQIGRNVLVSPCQSTTMKPHYSFERPPNINRIVYIQLAPLLSVCGSVVGTN